MLQIYNSLTKRKEVFEPLKPNKIGLYVCGVTVYDYCHIGHARTYLAFDVVIRFLRYLGYDVTYVRNITDIDDKIIKRAQENDESTEELVSRFTKVMHDEFAQLGITPPNSEPKATECIDGMLAMIQKLVDDEYAYQGKNGDVYFRVDRFEEYGKLSGQKLEDLQVGARIEADEDKENPLDFVLWKSAKEGEPAWDSAFGPGRPGWHIECSAMSKEILGDHFDIHAGGSDLRFPHHENEIAQSVAANGCAYAKYWMHSGMVQIDDEKMSKSLGNFFVISDVLKQYPAEIVRYFLISAHYRSQVNYSEENLNTAKGALTRFYTALRDLPEVPLKPGKRTKSFKYAMSDDFNTPEALAVLFAAAREINRLKAVDKIDEAAVIAAELKSLGNILGILQQDPEVFLQGDDDHAWIETLIAERKQARADKDFKRADEIRDEFAAKGVVLEDKGERCTWRFK